MVGRSLDAGAPALERCDVGWVLALEGAGVEGAGSLDVSGSEVGSSVGVDGGVDTGGGVDDACRVDDVGGSDVGVLPVPLACRFSP